MNDKQEVNSNIPVEVKVSRLAIAAICLALFCLISACILFYSVFNPWLTENGIIFFYLSFISLIIAFLFGIISLIRIDKQGGRLTGSNFAKAAIIISILVFFVSYMFLPALSRMRFEVNREVCGRNLSQIGKAMLIYADDYNGEFPRAGGKNSTWGTSVKWNAENQEQAYNISSDGMGGSVTISSSLYLLVKYSGIQPENFVCVFDHKIKEFNPSKYGISNTGLTEFWDFGPAPWKHCSYAYHMPYGQNQLTNSSDPGMAVAADRNPWISSLGWKAKDFSVFNPDGERKNRYTGNTPTHFIEGQMVLYLDSHVDFQMVSFCGINEDNIYTSWNGSDIRKGTPPKVGSQPADKLDSLLVNDPPLKNR